MKKTFLFAMALFCVGVASAQINTIWVNTSGDVILRQGDDFACSPGSFKKVDSVLYLDGSKDYEVTVKELNYLTILSSGDVSTPNPLRGKDLSVTFNSSGDSKLDLDYDNVYVVMAGKGDLVLRGHCNRFDFVHSGHGDLDFKGLETVSQDGTVAGHRAAPNLAGLSELLAELGTNLEALADSVDWESFERDMERWGESMEDWGRRMEEWGEQVERQMDGRGDRFPRRNRRPEQWGQSTPDLVPQPDVRPEKPQPHPETPQKRSLLLDPYWGGVDVGLNMLFGPGSSANFEGDYSFLELKPLKSWVFNLNIADVGIAFDRKHTAGLYTGIGLGWNNYSFNNPVRLVMRDDHLYGEPIDETVEGPVKKSKLGVLYVQAPLMLEIRPTRGFFIAAGVTGGVRVDSWTNVKFRDRYKEKVHGSYCLNPVKLDATLRAGSCDFGFFASYNLLPEFVEPKGPTARAFNVGFSLIF